ncbi:MAG: aspartyl protease family protein [Bacteroidota bacterium]|jgi:hypothetical protein
MKTIFPPILLLSLFCTVSGPSFSQNVMPLHEAVQAGLVEMRVTGRGNSSGDAIQLELRRSDEAEDEEGLPLDLDLSFEPGTVFRCLNPAAQDMIGSALRGEMISETEYRPTLKITLSDDALHRYLVEAYCLDFNKANPSTTDEFRIEAPDTDLAVLLREGKARSARVEVLQAAIWQTRGDVTDVTMMSRFPVDESMLDNARFLISTVRSDAPPPAHMQPILEPGQEKLALAEYLNAKGYRMVQLTRNTIGHFELTGTLGNDIPIRLIVDTGASSSLLDAAFLRAHDVELRKVEMTLFGVTGEAVDVWSATVPGLVFAGESTGPMTLFATDITSIIGGLQAAGSNEINGLIGSDILTRYGAVIDVRSGRLFLHIE